MDRKRNVQISVVLERSLVQSSLLTQPGNVITVVVGERPIAKDGIGNLWKVHQVHLEQLSLEVCVLLLVLLERLKKEACARLDGLVAHEDLDKTSNVGQRVRWVLHQGLCKGNTLVR